jgi:hypothetical protein
MNTKSPKSRPVKMSRKEKEFEMLLRQAARLRTGVHAAQPKRESSKSPAA